MPYALNESQKTSKLCNLHASEQSMNAFIPLRLYLLVSVSTQLARKLNAKLGSQHKVALFFSMCSNSICCLLTHSKVSIMMMGTPFTNGIMKHAISPMSWYRGSQLTILSELSNFMAAE